MSSAEDNSPKEEINIIKKDNTFKKVIVFNNQKYFDDYIDSLKTRFDILKIFNNRTKKDIILEEIQKADKETLFFFLQSLSINKLPKQFLKRIYIINTEQLTRQKFLLYILKIINQGVNIIDYSFPNISLLKINYKGKKQIGYLPYLPNPKEIYNFPKENQVAFIGASGSYRIQILNKLSNSGVKINMIKGWGAKRDKELFKNKILLNIHYAPDYMVFEEIRCSRCILNKMIVITQKSLLNIDYPLKKYMIICDYKDLVKTTIETIKNYEEIHKKLFSDFNLEEITEKYDKYITNFHKYLETETISKRKS